MLTLDLPRNVSLALCASLSLHLAIRFGDDFLLWHFSDVEPERRLPPLALFGPDRPGWRCLFLRVKRTSQLRARTSEFDPTRTSRVDARSLPPCHGPPKMPLETIRALLQLPLTAFDKVLGFSLSQRRG
jgi:hypothetical protein